MLELKECKREIFCKDCDNKECFHSGKIMADCPKYTCDNRVMYDCEHCEFIKQYYSNLAEVEYESNRNC